MQQEQKQRKLNFNKEDTLGVLQGYPGYFKVPMFTLMFIGELPMIDV